MYNHRKIINVMEKSIIIASATKSNRSENRVWTVSITGSAAQPIYCKSAYSAMRLMFLLKIKTGLTISDNCLSRLSSEIARNRAAGAARPSVAAIAQSIAESHAVDTVLNSEPKKKSARRKPRSRKSATTAATPA